LKSEILGLQLIRPGNGFRKELIWLFFVKDHCHKIKHRFPNLIQKAQNKMLKYEFWANLKSQIIHK
jgi:hypothetical protein